MADNIVKVHVRDGQPERFEFPHPLVTLHFDKNNDLIDVSCPAESVTAYGPMKFEAVEIGGR